MPTPQNIPTRADRFVKGLTLLWSGFYIGFGACLLWTNHWHPSDFTRNTFYWTFLMLGWLLSFMPFTVLHLYRGLRSHEKLEADMANRQDFKPVVPPPAGDPKST